MPVTSIWARLSDPDRGGTMIAYESDFANITLDADRFDTYLADPSAVLA